VYLIQQRGKLGQVGGWQQVGADCHRLAHLDECRALRHNELTQRTCTRRGVSLHDVVAALYIQQQ
jgi:hypothetical protein